MPSNDYDPEVVRRLLEREYGDHDGPIVSLMNRMRQDPQFRQLWRVLSLCPVMQCLCGRCYYVRLQTAAHLAACNIPPPRDEQAEATAHGDVEHGRDLYLKLVNEGRDATSVTRIAVALLTGVMYSLAAASVSEGKSEE